MAIRDYAATVVTDLECQYDVIEMLPHLAIVHFTFDSDALILWNC